MTSCPRFRHVRSGLLLLFVVGAVLLPGCGGPRAKQGAQHPAVGQPLMVLDLQPLTGEGTSITSASLQGRVTLMNFWATWCGPCRIEFPHMAAMAKKLSTDPKFQFISVNTDDESLEEAKILAAKFLLEQHATHPTWSDPSRGTWFGVGRQLGAGGIPLTIVFDTTGTIRGIWNGYVRGDEAAMEALVRELLSEK